MDTVSSYQRMARSAERTVLTRIRATAREHVSAAAFSWVELVLRELVLRGASYQRKSLPRQFRRSGQIDLRSPAVEYFVRARTSMILDVPGLVRDSEEVSLTLRPRLVSSTMVNAALFFGRHELLSQMIARGQLNPEWIARQWKTRRDERVRNSHVGLHDQVRPWGVPFVSPYSGAALMHPHDPSASVSEVANCRCSEIITVALP